MEKIKAIRFVGSLFRIRLGKKDILIEDTKGQFLEDNDNLEAGLIEKFLVVISKESPLIRVYTKRKKGMNTFEKVLDLSLAKDKYRTILQTFHFTP